MNKKGDKKVKRPTINTESKIFELCRRVFIKDSVHKQVLEIRKELGISSCGFLTFSSRLEFNDDEKFTKTQREFIGLSVWAILQKHQVPLTGGLIFHEMILCDLNTNCFAFDNEMSEAQNTLCAPSGSIEGSLIESSNVDSKELKIVISKYASVNDLKELVSREYRRMKCGTAKKINTLGYRRDTHTQIYTLSRSSIKTLRIAAKKLYDKDVSMCDRSDVISVLMLDMFGKKIRSSTVVDIIKKERLNRK